LRIIIEKNVSKAQPVDIFGLQPNVAPLDMVGISGTMQVNL